MSPAPIKAITDAEEQNLAETEAVKSGKAKNTKVVKKTSGTSMKALKSQMKSMESKLKKGDQNTRSMVKKLERKVN